MTDTLLSKYDFHVNEVRELQTTIDNVILNVGYRECLRIIKRLIYVDSDAVENTVATINNNCDNKLALLTFIDDNGINYEIRIIVMTDHDMGSNIDIGSALFNVGSDKRKRIINQMDTLESWLISNSVRLYNDIKSPIKQTIRGINTIVGSPKRRFVYYYPTNRRYQIAFIARKQGNLGSLVNPPLND